MSHNHGVFKLSALIKGTISRFFLLIRYEADGFLTVSTDVYTRETVMINGSSVSGNTMLQLTNQSAIYLGGLPANQSVNIDVIWFIHQGCHDQGKVRENYISFQVRENSGSFV